MRKTKILVLIASVIALVCALTVVAFAAAPENETPTAEGAVTLTTQYGNFIIPAEYADAEAYPLVAFNSDGRFIHASSVFCSGDDKQGAIMNKDYHTSTNEKHYIFLRTDYTFAGGGSTFWNFSWTLSEIVFDLQGHTFTLTAAPSEGLLYGEGKAAGVNVRFTMQNGTYNSKTTRALFMAQPSTKTTTFTFNFKNMVIKSDASLASNTNERYILATFKDNNSPVINYSMNFVDCTIDLTNCGSGTRLFVTDSQKYGNINSTYNFEGGTIIGDLSKLITFRHEDIENMTFSKNANGQYTTNTVATGSAAPTRILLCEEGLLSFKAADAVVGDNGYTVYTPTPETSPLATKYGWLPDDDAIITVFSVSTQNVVYTGNMMMNGENASNPNAILATDGGNATYAVYLRADVPASASGSTFYNFSRKSNTIIFEMNGYSIELNKPLMRAQLKGNGMVQRVIFNNGSFNMNGQTLIQAGNISSVSNAFFYSTFNGVTFNNISGGAYMFTVSNVDKDLTNTFIHTFNDCGFNFSSNYSGYLFYSPQLNLTQQFHVNGGYFNTPKSSMNTLSSIANPNAFVKFGKGTDGKFTEFITKGDNTTAAGTEAFLSVYGSKVVFTNAGKNADGNTLWTLAEATPYGYVPTEYLDTTLYPFAIFDKNGNFLVVKADLNGTNSENSAFMYVQANLKDDQKMTIYMRRDFTTSGDSTQNMAMVGKRSTLVVDLGGHTLTLGNHFFRSASQAPANTQAYQSIINGTINNGGYYVYGGGNSWNTKQFYVTFENIVFSNIKAAIVVTPLDKNSTDYRYIAHYHITFENCTFNVAAANTMALFHLGDTSNGAGEYSRVSVTLNGGTVNSNGNTLLYYVKNTAFVSNSIHFGADKNGNYTTFNNAENALSNITPLTKDGNKPLVMRKTGENSFVLTPFAFVSTYLNLKNNLNIVYRVCLPEGYTNPVATFTIGEDTVTVTEYTVDENGLYCFTLTSVAPHKMGDFVNATVVATYNSAEETISNNQVSIKVYADALRTQYAEDTAMLALLDSLLVYGAASQVYMNYNLDALVAEIGELASVLEAPITMSGETSAIANITACGLLLDGAFDLRVGIEATTLEGLTLEITKGDKTTVVELTADMMQGNYIVVYYDGLNINELDTEVSFTLKANGEVVGKTLTFSANAYLYRMQNSENTALATLTKALYAYGNAAKAYTA